MSSVAAAPMASSRQHRRCRGIAALVAGSALAACLLGGPAAFVPAARPDAGAGALDASSAAAVAVEEAAAESSPRQRRSALSWGAGAAAAAMFGLLAVGRPARAGIVTDVKKGKDTEMNGYSDFSKLSSLESRMTSGWDKIKPVCKEYDAIVNGGSRLGESQVKRVNCDRADLKAVKDAKKASEKLAPATSP